MGKWYADYQDLSTCAAAVQNRHATWQVPARRGENIAIPGRDGTIFAADKPFDEADFTLEMFAAGVELDGSMPIDKTRAAKVVENLDRLSRIFGTGKLLKLAYLEDSTVPYGRLNLHLNPSFEASDGTVVTRENVLQNPSGEYSSGTAVIRRNHIPNPNMSDATTEIAYRTNLVPSPRMMRDGRKTDYRTNLLSNPSFEVGTATWSKLANCSISRISDATVGIWPIAGRYSLQIKATAAGAASATAGPSTVTAGQSYTASAYVFNTAAGARNATVAIQWRNRRGSQISVSTGSAVSVGPGAAGRPFVSVSAPAGATQAVIRVIYTASGAGESARVDGVMLEKSASLGTYFDGSTDENDGYLHRWAGTSGASQSIEYGIEPAGWRSPSRLLTSSANPLIGTRAAKVELSSAPASGTLLFAQTIAEGCNIGTYTALGGLIHVMAKPGITPSVAVRISCYDAGGTLLGVLRTTPTGTTPVADTSGAVEDSVWTAYEINGYAQAGTVRACLEVYTSGATLASGDYLYFDGAMVEPTTATGDYFDGEATDPNDFNYKWKGTVDWSESVMVGITPGGWNPSYGRAYQTGPGLLGPYCLRIEADATGAAQVMTVPTAVQVGKDHTFSIYVKPNRTQNFTASINIDGTVTSGTATSCTAGAWTRISVTVNVPSGASSIKLTAAASATSQAGDIFDVDAALFEAAGVVRTYFDGASGAFFAWEGNANGSSSVWLQPKADGWNAWGNASVYQTTARVSGGTAAVLAAANYAGSFGVTSGRDTVTAGTSYSFGADVSLDVSRTVRFGIRWADSAGAFISESTTDVAVTAGTTFTRGAVTATPPANAKVASIYIAVLSANAGEVLYVDKAIFGFGGTTTYADGSSGSGWKWTGTTNNSISQQVAAAVGGLIGTSSLTVSQSGLWKADRSYSALVVANSTTQPHYVTAFPTGAQSPDDYFRNDSSQQITFSVDVRGREAGQVALEVVPYTWDGWQMTAGAAVTGSKISVAAGATVRPLLSAKLSSTYTHFRVRVYLYNTTGGAAALSQGVYLDRLIVGYGGWDGSYFDGASTGAIWEGSADHSRSRFVGDARVADVEVRAAVPIASRAYGRAASLQVQLHAPDVFFRDQAEKTLTMAVGRSGMVYYLYGLAGGTAHITDSWIRLWGPITSPTILDVRSGAWVKIDRPIAAGQFIEIDNSDWTVMVGSTSSPGVMTNVIDSVTYSGAAVMLPITPGTEDPTPALQITAPSIGDGAVLEVHATRKFFLA